MARFLVTEADGVLVVERNRKMDALTFACFALAAALTLGLLWLPTRHGAPAWLRLDLTACLMPVFTIFGWAMADSCRRRTFVFDRAQGQVSFNGWPVQAMAELQSVYLERVSYRDSQANILFLRTKNRVQIEITREGLPGGTLPEMRRMAERIADYAGVDLVTPDGFMPGWRSAIISSDRLKRQGKRPCQRLKRLKADGPSSRRRNLRARHWGAR